MWAVEASGRFDMDETEELVRWCVTEHGAQNEAPNTSALHMKEIYLVIEEIREWPF